MLDSLPAEQSLLGAAMLWPDALDDISLAESDFQSQANGLIWRAIQQLLVRGEAIDALTVADQLERDGHLDDVGGLEYLSGMAQSVYSPAGIKSHAEQIRERGVRRGLLAALRTIGESLHTDGDIAAVLDRAQAQIMAIGERAETRQPVSVLDVARDRITALEDILDGKDKAWNTGLTDLDAKLGNIRAGDLVVIAGRPAMGKSAFAIQVAAQMATPESPALIFSLEMSSAQLVDRLMSSAGRVNLKKFRTGALEEQDWDGLTVALGRMQEMPVYLDDHSHTLGQILSTARQFKRRHGLGCVVVDYIGLVTTEADSREQEVAKITRSLKLAAKQLECPILALSQLNRKLEDRVDKRPQMADTRESGSIEQDADQILMLYRDEVYNPDSPNKGICEVLIRKNRHGETGTVLTTFCGENVRFSDFFGQYAEQNQRNSGRRMTRGDL
jgi:replicative DNA helicase